MHWFKKVACLIGFSFIVGRIPPLPGVYYNLTQNAKLGYPFSGLTYESHRGSVVEVSKNGSIQAYFLPEVASYPFLGLRAGERYNKGELSITFGDLEGVPYLGDSFPNFESRVLNGSYRWRGGESVACHIIDYNGGYLMVVPRKAGDDWQDYYTLIDSVGTPLTPMPTSPDSYHRTIFLITLTVGAFGMAGYHVLRMYAAKPKSHS